MSRPRRRVGETTWSSSASHARAIRFSIQVSKDGWRDDMKFFCITCKSNPILYSGEQGWLEGRHGLLLHHIRFSIPVSKEGWRDDMEFFCITCKSNPVFYSGDKGFLET